MLSSNKRGQMTLYIFMIAVVVILFALGVSGALKEQVEIARNPNNLDCANTSISKFDKVNCIATDINQFYFIGGLVALGLGFVGVKIIFTE